MIRDIIQEIRDRWYDLHQSTTRVVVSTDVYLKLLEETSHTMHYTQTHGGVPTLMVHGPVGMVPVTLENPKEYCEGCGAPLKPNKCEFCGHSSSFIRYEGF